MFNIQSLCNKYDIRNLSFSCFKFQIIHGEFYDSNGEVILPSSQLGMV